MHQDNKAKAVLFMLMSAVAFAFMSAFVKLTNNSNDFFTVVDKIPVAQQVFFRNLVSLIVALIALRSAGIKGPVFGKKENQGYLMLRSFMGLAGVALNFYAINHLKLADSSMLNKLSPFFVTLFAWFFLKEKLSKLQWPALVIVFAAAMLIIKPEFKLTMLPALCGTISALCAGAAYTVIRHLKGRENPASIIFYFSFVSVVGSFPFMMMNFQMPTGPQLFCLLMVGVAASFGQFGITLAYKYAKAAEVSIYNYTSIIFAGLVGYAIWGKSEVPDMWSLIGGAGIITTAIFMYWYNSRSARCTQ